MRTLLLAIAALINAVAALAVSEVEPNDETWLANAAACGDTVVCATLSPWYETDCFSFYVQGVDSIHLITNSCNGSVNTLLALYDENDSLLATDDDGGPGACSYIRYRTNGPGTFVARVYGQMNSADSVYSLFINCLNPPPEAFDICTTPRVITALPYYDEGTTYGATNETGTASPDVFYRFYSPATGNYRITVCSTTWDARVQILTGCYSGFLDDASTGCNLGADLFTFGLSEGDYTILVEGTADNQQGDFSLEVLGFLPDCPGPSGVVVTTIGGLPFLDWPQLDGPEYYIIWSASTPDGLYEHLGVSPVTYFADSTGYAAARKFYHVTSFCPW